MANRIAARQMQILGKDSGKKPLLSAEVVKRTQESYSPTNGNIAAIDFGTTSITLAYTTSGDEEINTLALNETNYDARITNAILLSKSPDGTLSVSAFGQDARTNYSKARNQDDYVYFERIKMLMKRDKNNVIDHQSPVEAFSGEKYYLVEVIAFILKYIKDYFLEYLKKMNKEYKATDFDWVITVPAIWDPRGKRMMREAGYLAGLVTEIEINKLTPFGMNELPSPEEVNAEKLTLALEPECAALYSQPATEIEVAKADDPRFLAPEGAYMVLDIGGGTVDITAQVKRGDTIEVINAPSGNDWGGTIVNEQFSLLLQNVVGDKGFTKFLSENRSKHQIILNDLLYKEFESQKVVFGENPDQLSEIAIKIPRAIIEFYGEDRLLKGAAGYLGVAYDKDLENIYIKSPIVEKELFGPVFREITHCVMIAIDTTHEDIDTYYFVGGFGGCKYLYETLSEAIKAKYGPSRNMIVPPSPKLAIAQGAIIWRKNPSNITGRISDATYGIELQTTFDEEKHDRHYRYFNEEHQQYVCSNVLSVFCQRGDIVKPQDLYVIKNVTPVNQSLMTMKFDLLSTINRGIQYVKDKNGEMVVTKLGELVLHVPNKENLPREKRFIDITMDFSSTEIQAKAKYHVTGEEVKTVCDFLSVAKPFAK